MFPYVIKMTQGLNAETLSLCKFSKFNNQWSNMLKIGENDTVIREEK